MSYLMSIAFRIFEVAGESGERVEWLGGVAGLKRRQQRLIRFGLWGWRLRIMPIWLQLNYFC
jgi:hypothetical protein